MISGILIASGGLGIFLLGMVIMTGGLKSLAGDTLRKTLAQFTKSPLSGAITGAASTALIQSSSATTVTAVGFVGAGLLSFKQALGIIFGANIGTTITGWLVAVFGFKLKIGELALPLILVGVLMHLFLKHRASTAGMALTGFGLIFVGIEALQEGMAGLQGIVTPASFPSDTFGGRFLLILIGIGITLVTQSSSAGVATALTAVHTGTITFSQAAAMVIGMDVGTTVTAAMATIGGSTDARQTGFAHVSYNLLTRACAFCFLSPYVWACTTIAPNSLLNNPEIALVGFHTFFNTLGVILVLPFTGAFERLIVWLVPERSVQFTQRLDRSLYESPALAIEAVRSTLKDLALVVFEQLNMTLDRGSSADSTSTLAEANEALKRTRDYLELIDTSADHMNLYPKHLSSIHTIDHLRRLIDRCEEADRAERALSESDLLPLDAELRDAVEEVIVGFGQASTTRHETTLKNIWQKFDTHAERYRRSLIEDAAAGKRDAYSTIGKLDTLRWLRRVAYHLWRIVHHLSQARLDKEVDDLESFPPHLEHESSD